MGTNGVVGKRGFCKDVKREKCEGNLKESLFEDLSYSCDVMCGNKSSFTADLFQ